MDDEFDYLTVPMAGDTSALDAVTRQQLLDLVEELGNVQDACCECHLTESDLIQAMDEDQKLHSDLNMAMGRCRAGIRRRIATLAFEGYEVPVIGGKDKDTVVATQVLPDPKALQIISQMHFSKDMAQYTRSEVKSQEIKPAEKDDSIDTSRLARSERTQFDSLMAKARGHIEKIEKKESQ